MNDVVNPGASASVDAVKLGQLKQLTLITYILYAVSAFVGITAIVAILINYIKREDTAGTIYESHFTWQIRTFWWSLAWCVLGIATAVVLVGVVIMLVSAVWFVYRIVRGWTELTEGRPMYA